MTYLFSVKDRFSIDGRGTMLTPGISWHDELPVIVDGVKIRLRMPDLTEVDTFIKSIEVVRYRSDIPIEQHTRPILLPKNFHKHDVPIGTEVYLLDDL